jgi:hypothetical protein
MKAKRKQELESYLNQLQNNSRQMQKALKRNDALSEEMALNQLKTLLPVIEALYEELQRLRGV